MNHCNDIGHGFEKCNISFTILGKVWYTLFSLFQTPKTGRVNLTSKNFGPLPFVSENGRPFPPSQNLLSVWTVKGKQVRVEGPRTHSGVNFALSKRTGGASHTLYPSPSKEVTE